MGRNDVYLQHAFVCTIGLGIKSNAEEKKKLSFADSRDQTLHFIIGFGVGRNSSLTITKSHETLIFSRQRIAVSTKISIMKHSNHYGTRSGIYLQQEQEKHKHIVLHLVRQGATVSLKNSP